MKKELQDKLFEKYPILFSRRKLPMNVTCMCWGIECDDGWYDLINKVCSEITKADAEEGYVTEFEQVKEKYGGLRLYATAETGRVSNIIRAAEEESYKTCEVCGHSETARPRRNSVGWIATLCDGCAKLR